jgi:hypothetical protein
MRYLSKSINHIDISILIAHEHFKNVFNLYFTKEGLIIAEHAFKLTTEIFKIISTNGYPNDKAYKILVSLIISKGLDPMITMAKCYDHFYYGMGYKYLNSGMCRDIASTIISILKVLNKAFPLDKEEA